MSSAIVMRALSLMRIGDQPAHDGDALDDFGHALDGEQQEAGEQQRLRRPEDQAAGIGRMLLLREAT